MECVSIVPPEPTPTPTGRAHRDDVRRRHLAQHPPGNPDRARLTGDGYAEFAASRQCSIHAATTSTTGRGRALRSSGQVMRMGIVPRTSSTRALACASRVQSTGVEMNRLNAHRSSMPLLLHVNKVLLHAGRPTRGYDPRPVLLLRSAVAGVCGPTACVAARPYGFGAGSRPPSAPLGSLYRA